MRWRRGPPAGGGFGAIGSDAAGAIALLAPRIHPGAAAHRPYACLTLYLATRRCGSDERCAGDDQALRRARLCVDIRLAVVVVEVVVAAARVPRRHRAVGQFWRKENTATATLLQQQCSCLIKFAVRALTDGRALAQASRTCGWLAHTVHFADEVRLWARAFAPRSSAGTGRSGASSLASRMSES